MTNEKWLIDANELVSLMKYYDEQQRTDMWETSEIEHLLGEISTVDAVEVVHGRWEWITEDIYGCTNCGVTNHVKEVMGQPDFNYCPNCGAKMDGGKDNG